MMLDMYPQVVVREHQPQAIRLRLPNTGVCALSLMTIVACTIGVIVLAVVAAIGSLAPWTAFWWCAALVVIAYITYRSCLVVLSVQEWAVTDPGHRDRLVRAIGPVDDGVHNVGQAHIESVLNVALEILETRRR